MAAQLAELVRVTDAPTGALGYGRDLSCVMDCDERFSEVRGDGPLIIAQAVVRRFVTPRGRLIGAADYGRDVRGYLNRGVTASELRKYGSQLRAEATKDERVDEAEVEAGVSADLRVLTLRVRLTPRAPLAPFSFVVSVTDASVLLELLELQAGA